MHSKQAWFGVVLPLIAVWACARERQGRLPDTADSGATARAVIAPSVGCSEKELAEPPRQVLTGLATYYHDSLAGSPTASGQAYDPARMSAAHRTLPFGTRLRVRRPDLAHSPITCVTVNDRGPFAGRGRILDVSRQAAERLQMISAGIVKVRIEVLGIRGR